MAELFDVARFPFWKDVLPLAVVVAMVGGTSYRVALRAQPGVLIQTRPF